MTVLERLFSKADRVRLFRFFIFHPDHEVTAAELTRRLGRRVATRVSRTLTELVRLGCIMESVRSGTSERSYRANVGWVIFPEMRALFVKAQLLVEHDLVRRLQQTGRLRLLILSGLFVGERQSSTDILIVGFVNRRRVGVIMKQFERDLNEEVRYTVMTPAEYQYRTDVGDRFVYGVLEQRHLVVADTLHRRTSQTGVTVRSSRKRKRRTRRKAR